MSQNQETELNQLVDVIQALQSERATGLLRVRRGIDVTLEEGTVVFVNGQVEEAKAEGRIGIKALNWLSTWSKCQFQFVPARESVSPPLSDTQAKLLGDTNPFLFIPTSPPGQPGTFTGEEKVTEEIELPYPSAPPPQVPYRIQQLDAALQEIDQRGFSRRHRLLLFWLDGRRSTTELMSLVKCSEYELHQMLLDLKRAAVICIP